MTALFFVIAAIALLAALALLWIDRRRSQDVRHRRAVWGEDHNLRYRASDDSILDDFSRATMDLPEHARVIDVAYGTHYGEEVLVFDVESVATVVALRRTTSSSVQIDLRQERALAPSEDDVELLGAMGQRVMFASHLDVARRICDRRMVALSSNAPEYIQVLWNEGPWSLGSMPVTDDDEKLDALLETVRRFTDLLRALPPEGDRAVTTAPRDPSSPTGRARRGMEEPKTEDFRREDLRRANRHAESDEQ